MTSSIEKAVQRLEQLRKAGVIDSENQVVLEKDVIKLKKYYNALSFSWKIRFESLSTFLWFMDYFR